MIALLLSWTMLGMALHPVPVQATPLAVTVAEADGFRPLLRVGKILEDPELEEAVRAGVPLRLGLRTELWRDGFFNSLDGSDSVLVTVFYQPLEERFVVRAQYPGRTEVRGFDSFNAVRSYLQRDYEPALRPRRRGRYYYTAVLELETLTLSDLAELERWLKGELQPAVSGERSVPSAVGQGVKRLLVRVLRLPARRYEARSPWFRVGDEG